MLSGIDTLQTASKKGEERTQEQTDIAYSFLTPEERELLIKSKDTIHLNKYKRQMEEKAEREKALEEK